MILRKSFFICLLVVYGLICFQQEQFTQKNQYYLPFPTPAIVQKSVLGFLRQIGGEMLFIKTSVFLGGKEVTKLTDMQTNSLSENFKVMSELNPPFVDTYFLCQATLPYLGTEKVEEANVILNNGINALPEKWVLPFYAGFNHFYFLNENIKAGEHLLNASRLPGAASWLGHLASVLAAEGGDIFVGLTWLRAMRESEDDNSLKERIDEDIAKFEQALKIEKAVLSFQDKYKTEPSDLELLVPEFLPEIPDFGKDFVLVWQPPFLSLKRPKTARAFK